MIQTKCCTENCPQSASALGQTHIPTEWKFPDNIPNKNIIAELGSKESLFHAGRGPVVRHLTVTLALPVCCHR